MVNQIMASIEFLKHYANTHSLLHFSAKISTKTYSWIHQRILEFVHASPVDFTCFFMGSGVTAGMNRMAKTFNRLRPEKDMDCDLELNALIGIEIDFASRFLPMRVGPMDNEKYNILVYCIIGQLQPSSDCVGLPFCSSSSTADSTLYPLSYQLL